MATAATISTASAVVILHPDQATWDREVRAYLDVTESAGLSPNTVKTYGASLRAWATWRQGEGLSLDPAAATRREAQAWVGHLTRTVKSGTAGTRYSNLVTFYRWMVQEWSLAGDVRPSPFDHVKGPKVTPPRVPVLEAGTMDRLLAACAGSSYQDVRDRALIALGVSTGLRRSEIAAIAVEDLDMAGRRLRVRGKGDTDAWVPFGQTAADALRVYLRKRAAHRDRDMVHPLGIRSDRMTDGHPLFLVHPRGAYGGVTSETVRSILTKRARQAGVGHVHVHQLRHTFAHELLAAGVESADVMTLGRWTNPRVMARYGADLKEARAAAAYVDPLARGKVRRVR